LCAIDILASFQLKTHMFAAYLQLAHPSDASRFQHIINQPLTYILII